MGTFLTYRCAIPRPAGAQPAALPAGSAPRGDADPVKKAASSTFLSCTALRRLARSGGRQGFVIFPRSTTPPRRLPRLRRVRRLRRPRRAISAFSPPVDPEAERATGRKGMVMWALSSLTDVHYPARPPPGSSAHPSGLPVRAHGASACPQARPWAPVHGADAAVKHRQRHR